MPVVLRKNDRLSDLIPIIHAKPICHQNIQDFTNRIFIKHPVIKCRRIDLLRKISIFCLKSLLVLLLILLRKFIVDNPIFNKF